MTRRMTAGRFWQRVDSSAGPGVCWPWTGSLHADGYGKLRWAGANVLAHRTAYALIHGEIPAGLCIRHRCDNPPCCNPDHLEIGTWADNVMDTVSRGRHVRGELSPMAKLSEAAVKDIRRGFRNGKTRYELAERFHVSHTLICQVIKRKKWRHVDETSLPDVAGGFRAVLRERIKARRSKVSSQ